MAAGNLTNRARQVLSLVRRGGGISRATLSRQTGLSGTAIFRATEELRSAGLVEIGETIADGPGAPSALIRITPNSVFSLGLSITTDRAEAVLIDLAGAIRAKKEVTVDGMPRASILESTRQFAHDALQREGVPLSRLKGIGVAIAGFFVEDGTVNPREELNDWALVDIEAEVTSTFQLPVMVDNIANAAAVGEKLLGVGSEYPSFCYVNIGSGVGGGIIIDGQLLRGRHGNAAEIGGLFSIAGLPVPNMQSLQAVLARNGVSHGRLGEISASFDPEWPGIDEWLKLYRRSFEYLFWTLRIMIDSDAIVLGGLLPPALAERVIAQARWPEHIKSPRRDRGPPAPVLCVAQLPSDTAATIGAASLLLAGQLFA